MPEITEQFRAAQVKALEKKFEGDLLLEAARRAEKEEWHPLRDILVAEDVLVKFLESLNAERMECSLIEFEDLIAVCLNIVGVCERWGREHRALAVENGDVLPDENYD